MSRCPLLALILLTTFSSAAQADCWLTDWLCGKKETPQPVVAGYLPAGPPQPYQVNYVQPAAPISCAPVYQNQTSVRYIPETQYQTTYKPVPVTVYQPTTVYLPGSNVPTLAYNGCTTYRWETERVPYTTYKPVIQNVQTQVNSCATVGYMQAAPAMQGAPAVMGSCNNCNGATGPSPYAAQGQPMQSYPAGQGQWVPAQGGGASSMVNPPSTYPQGAAQPMPSSQYNVAPYQQGGSPQQGQPYPGSSPADQPPALNPNEVTPPNYNNRSTLRVTPEANSVLRPTPGATIIKPSPQPTTTPSIGSGAAPMTTPGTTSPSTPPPSNTQSLAAPFTPYAPSSSQTTQTPSTVPSGIARPQLNPLIKPIPDPDYYPTRTTPQDQAPALLNPHDKSALLPTAKIVPIAWDEVATPTTREVSYETPTVSIPAKKNSWHQIGR
ncbi:hypothetical protein M4951_18605 [Blastopirellula sp. J2-11]|uniref:hypothetical protein n=1 Tax=Blastopirellula sp. J2-11 TaxID=2943192 RepID=UPI0021C8E218|nr:hypothetical protein [Blastopirellula sp. J2-11]UUO05379.1 hypothetical protein M4951_18605 [Blastopirellula sp. J2-11]